MIDMNYFCIMNVSSASNLLGSPKIYTFKQTYLIVRDFDNIWIYHIDFTKIVHKKRWPQEKYSIVLDEDVQKKKKKKNRSWHFHTCV